MNDYDSAVRGWLAGRDSAGEGGAMPESFRMLNSFRRSPDQIAALERVKVWTRERFKLPEDTAILVSQINCTVPGCPPLETVVAFWTDGDKRHHFKVFKPVADLVPDDLPPSWMKNALVALDGVECDCC